MKFSKLVSLIVVVFLCSSVCSFAALITYTFDSNDFGVNPIMKTNNGVVMTFIPRYSTPYSDDKWGLQLNDGSSFSFSQQVKLLSYSTLYTAQQGTGTFNVNEQANTTELIFDDSSDLKNFNNQFTVAANNTVSLNYVTGSGTQIYLKSIIVETVVIPEPVTVSLLGLGLGFAILRLKRRH